MNTEEQYSNEEMNEISIKELIEIIWSYKWLILILTILSGAIAFTAGQVVDGREQRVETIVSLEWNGLVDGTYPDGDRFIYNNMFESYVLGDALSESGITDITTTELRSHLSIQPIIPNNVVSLVEQSLQQGEQITYYATEYKLLIDVGQLEIDDEKGKLLLENLIEAFKVDFENKYIKKAVVLSYTNIDLTSYDYDETYQVLSNQTDLLESVIEQALESGSNFTSSSLQLGFDDLLSRLNLIRSVELKNINTRVNNYMLTKEIDFMITRYEYMVEENTLALNKMHDYETVLLEDITTYTGNETVVIIPGLDTEYSVDPYINQLYEELVTAQKEITVLENDIAYYDGKIAELTILEESNNLQSEEYLRQISLVETSIVSASQRIDLVAVDLDTMLEEYNTYITRNTVLPLTSPQTASDTNVLLYTAIGTVLGGMVSLLVVFLRETLKKD
ncbi:MAG: hypothetical protein ACVCEJ_06955 [Candidatus Izemoplasmataceae bacterium]